MVIFKNGGPFLKTADAPGDPFNTFNAHRGNSFDPEKLSQNQRDSKKISSKYFN